MPKMLVLCYSQTGNTEKMARTVVEGAQSTGSEEAAVKNVELKGKLGAAFGS